jgi:predicted DNA-binding protein with PD1-like motif
MSVPPAMGPPSEIRQPGPVAAARVVAIPCRGAPLRLKLKGGERLLDAVAQGFAQAGCESGVAELGALRLDPFRYVMPAPARTAEHAAFYSEVFAPQGGARLHAGALTFGLRDGAPFFHAHALWREADGKESGGHILPEPTFLADDAEIDAFGLDGARFEATQDAETNFKLFEPVAAAPNGRGERRALALRLRPNIPFLPTLDACAREAGFADWRARGGVGSLIGARFADGAVIAPFATEVFLRAGEAAPREIGLVDMTGAVRLGAITERDNPVLMTFELCLAEAD